MDALKDLHDKKAKYWDERLEYFLFCDIRDSNPSKVVIVDLDVLFPEESPSWDEFDQP